MIDEQPCFSARSSFVRTGKRAAWWLGAGLLLACTTSPPLVEPPIEPSACCGPDPVYCKVAGYKKASIAEIGDWGEPYHVCCTYPIADRCWTVPAGSWVEVK